MNLMGNHERYIGEDLEGDDHSIHQGITLEFA
jgi:hypothetical protein